MGKIFGDTPTKDLLGAYGVVTDANDRYKAQADEASVQKYLAAMVNNEPVDTKAPDFNALAHHKANLAITEQQKNSEAVKQQRMASMSQKIKTNSETFTQAFQLANTAKASGDTRRAKDILMASYNDLSPDGYKLGWQGNKLIMQGPDGSIKDAEVTDDEMWKMAQQMSNPEAYAQSYVGQYAKNKATNAAILASPEEIVGPKGETALKFAGLVDKDTGEMQPTYYTYRGQTYDENWARENGFESLKTKADKNTVAKGGADASRAASEASMAAKENKNYEADRAMNMGVKHSQMWANYNQQSQQTASNELTNANKVTPITGLDGKPINLSNTEYKALEDQANAATQNVTMGLTKISPEQFTRFNQMVSRSPEFGELVRAYPTIKDKKSRKEIGGIIEALLHKAKMSELVDHMDRLPAMIK